MRKKSIFLMVLILLCVFVAVFFFFCDTCYFIDDYFTDSVYYKCEILKLRVKLLKYKVVLKRISLKTDDLQNPLKIEETLKMASKSQAVFLGPSVAFVCNKYDINASQVLDGVDVVAITSNNSKNYFTSILVSDDKQAWDEASESIKDNQDVVLCNDISMLNEYLSTEDYPKKLIVDYRDAEGIPKKVIYGVIAPNFAKMIPVTEEKGKLTYDFIKIR